MQMQVDGPGWGERQPTGHWSWATLWNRHSQGREREEQDLWPQWPPAPAWHTGCMDHRCVSKHVCLDTIQAHRLLKHIRVHTCNMYVTYVGAWLWTRWARGLHISRHTAVHMHSCAYWNATHVSVGTQGGHVCIHLALMGTFALCSRWQQFKKMR